MIIKTCCFTGHRNLHTDLHTEQRINHLLRGQIKRLYDQGVIYYGCGGALGFDMLAARAVLQLRGQLPLLRLIMVLPCKHQDKDWQPADRRIFGQILSHADKTVYVSQKYDGGCMARRNRYLVDNSSRCLCYFDGSRGGTMQTVAYAMERGLDIINIFDGENGIKHEG